MKWAMDKWTMENFHFQYFEYVMAHKNCPTNVKEAFDFNILLTYNHDPMLNIMNRKCLKVHLLSVRMIFIDPRKKWYFKVFLVLSFGIFLYNCGVNGKEVILRILFSL